MRISSILTVAALAATGYAAVWCRTEGMPGLERFRDDTGEIVECLRYDVHHARWGSWECGNRRWSVWGKFWKNPKHCLRACMPCLENAALKSFPQVKCKASSFMAQCEIKFDTNTIGDKLSYPALPRKVVVVDNSTELNTTEQVKQALEDNLKSVESLNALLNLTGPDEANGTRDLEDVEDFISDLEYEDVKFEVPTDEDA